MAASKKAGWTVDTIEEKTDLTVGVFLDGKLVSRFGDEDAAKAFVDRQPAPSSSSSE